MPDRGQLIEIFADTRHFYESNEILREAVRVSTMNTKYYPADFNVDTNKQKSGKLRIIMGRTVKTAFNLSREFPDKKIRVRRHFLFSFMRSNVEVRGLVSAFFSNSPADASLPLCHDHGLPWLPTGRAFAKVLVLRKTPAHDAAVDEPEKALA